MKKVITRTVIKLNDKFIQKFIDERGDVPGWVSTLSRP